MKIVDSLAAGAVAALILLGQAAAGEIQVTARFGQNWLDIKGSHLTSGNGVNERLINLGIAVSHRWERGGLVELGLDGSGGFDILGIESVSHRWIAGGWQYDLADDWQFTPKAGLAYTHLTSSEEDFFDSDPVDKFSDWVPFVELTLQRRFGKHFGTGLYFRHTFEAWGSTRDFGLGLGWRF